MTLIASTPVDSLSQLNAARQLLTEQFSPDDPLTLAALSLIDCAAVVVNQLPRGDAASAQQALDWARAAVIAATYAVRRFDDLSRTETP